MNPKLEVKKTSKYGTDEKGVFAKKSVLKNEQLAIFGGYIIDLKNGQSEISGDYCLQISDSFVIGPANENDLLPADYFNHSCEPNAGIKGQIFLVAMRDIKKDEEITFDYAMVLQHIKGAPLYKFNCSCNSKSCRTVITENDWKIQKLQRKYRGYFNIFIQEKILSLKAKK